MDKTLGLKAAAECSADGRGVAIASASATGAAEAAAAVIDIGATASLRTSLFAAVAASFGAIDEVDA